MNSLYPLKFVPQILDKIWGGSKLKDILHKPTSSPRAGESWEISGYTGFISEVSNGFLEGNDLNELIEVYMGDLVGDRIFEKFGSAFPLLIKFIEAKDDLSIQVHPDDQMAKKRHNSFGKTEMWYILQADPGAELIIGFNREVDKEIYMRHLIEKKLMSILNTEPVKSGDVFFMPAKRVHAIGAGILLAEIQQTSDLTYRIYDFERQDSEGNYRELHTDLAVDSIDYTFHTEYKTKYTLKENFPSTLVESPFFQTNKINLSESLEKDINDLDCFVIYMCVEGACTIHYYENEALSISKGESVLVPASLVQYRLEPSPQAELLEIFIPGEKEKDY